MQKSFRRKRFFFFCWAICAAAGGTAAAQTDTTAEIPAVYSNIQRNEFGRMYVSDVQNDGMRVYSLFEAPRYTLSQLRGNPRGTGEGIAFDFGNLEGTLHLALLPPGHSRYPFPVYRATEDIRGGKASVNLKKSFSGAKDLIGLDTAGRGMLAYRVVNREGEMLYEGRTGFSGAGPFTTVPTIVEGPFVNLPTPEGATIWFESDTPMAVQLAIGGKIFADSVESRRHIFTLRGLQPDREYSYAIIYGEQRRDYAFKTAPAAGSREAFSFAYCSDSRAAAAGGGERQFFGVNYYVMKKIMALSAARQVAFVQFTGDMISGYLQHKDEINLQYANWKRAVEPYWHYFPIYVGMGNHETLNYVFQSSSGDRRFKIDRFPFSTESSEAVFADNFVNPLNGPESEDGASYDPDPTRMDFPSYKENVFYYTYANAAVIVLNSNYFYAPSKPDRIAVVSGSPHGYIMDRQLEWLEETVRKLEADPNIDHIFATVHTPLFPNGGHLGDDMWYHGNNDVRAYVAGKPLEKGILERRDDLLDILVNRSAKTVAILTGDEHNYSRLKISDEMERYPENYTGKRLSLSRSIYQVNNGSAGAPYYAQGQAPWTPQVVCFTTQYAVVFFRVSGKKVSAEVINPDTLEEIERFELR